jgi:hypothetical protein
MKSSKKSVAGHAVSQSLLSGESEMVNKGSSVKTVAFCLPEMLLIYGFKTALPGLESGF